MNEKYLGNDVYATTDDIRNDDLILSVRGVNAISDRIYLDADSIDELLHYIAGMRKELSK